MANPKYVTLVADTDTEVELDSNFGYVEVSLISGVADTQFNTSDTAIASSSLTDGNHVLTATLPTKTVVDRTSGGVSVVHLRSSGMPTVQVFGL